jgi:hypothetical protein
MVNDMIFLLKFEKAGLSPVTSQQDVGLTTNLVQSPLEDLSDACLETLDQKEKISRLLPIKSNALMVTEPSQLVGICLTLPPPQADKTSIQTLIQVSRTPFQNRLHGGEQVN